MSQHEIKLTAMILIRRILLTLVVSALPLFSQSFTGRILGTVNDQVGAVIPGASITVTSLDTNRVFEASTNTVGNYAVSSLERGGYEITVSAPGFKRFVRRGIILEMQQQARVDVILEVGTLSESIEVTADAPLLETTDSTLGKVVDNQRIVSLPLNSRNVFSLLYLTPGVTGRPSTTYGTGYGLSGSRNSYLNVLVDGISTAHPTVNGTTGNSTFPPVDAVAEFKVSTNYSAEFGRSNGGIVNIVYKSGGNDPHGSAFWFLRNSVLDANDFFNNIRGNELGSFKRNQFGAHATGPIIKNRTFFLASYEGLRQRSFASTTRTVPTVRERGGDFSQTFASNGNQIRIFDPFTTGANPDGGFVRQAFRDNMVPAGIMDPVALNVIKYYPTPNTPGNPVTNRNNFYNTGSARFDQDQLDWRVDHNLSDDQRFFVRFSWRENINAPPQMFPSDLGIAEGRVERGVRQPSASIDYSNTLNPTTILTARAGLSRSLFIYDNQGLGFQPSSLGLPADMDRVVDRAMFPRFAASGFVNLGGSDHRWNAFMTYTALGNITKMVGNHTFKFGYEGRLIRVNVWEARAAGTFGFNSGFTQGPNPSRASSTAGNSMASLLLGTGTSGNTLIRNWKNVASQSFYHSWYLQDDWRVTNKLSLNLGLRYEFDLPRTERYNRMNWFEPSAASPLAGQVPGFDNLTGGVRFVGVDGNPRTQYNKDFNNIGPRFGFAYQLDSKTVVRAGYGHYFGPSRQGAAGTVGPFGFRVEYLWVPSVDGGLTPFNRLSDPYPEGFRNVPGASDGLLTQAGANLQAFLQDSPSPWNMVWNLTIQRELPGEILLETAYLGNRGLYLHRSTESGMNINQLDPSHMALGSQLNELVDNPFFGVVNNGVHLSPRISRAQLLRPYPQFTSIVPLYDAGSNSIYHSWQNTLKKRLSGGLQFEGSYTWGKLIDSNRRHQNTYDVAASRALSDADVAHRFVMGTFYNLPFGRGRRFGADASGISQALFGGWQVNGIITYQSGLPLRFTARNTSGVLGYMTVPNNSGQSGKLTGRVQDRLGEYFNTDVFSQPSPFTFGNHSVFSPDIRSDVTRNWDLSIFKQFHITEKLQTQFRAEFFNAFNTPRFSNPNTSVTSSSFGRITRQANDSRQVQFGLKFLW